MAFKSALTLFVSSLAVASAAGNYTLSSSSSDAVSVITTTITSCEQEVCKTITKTIDCDTTTTTVAPSSTEICETVTVCNNGACETKTTTVTVCPECEHKSTPSAAPSTEAPKPSSEAPKPSSEAPKPSPKPTTSDEVVVKTKTVTEVCTEEKCKPTTTPVVVPTPAPSHNATAPPPAVVPPETTLPQVNGASKATFSLVAVVACAFALL